MKTRVAGLYEPRALLPIARFGAARLFQRPDGGADLRGGAGPDRTEAKEWISLFAHELGLSFSSSTPEKEADPRRAQHRVCV